MDEVPPTLNVCVLPTLIVALVGDRVGESDEPPPLEPPEELTVIGTLILYQYSTFILKFQVYSNINTKIGSLKSTLFLNRVKCSWGHKCNY